jgi:hypothetical protein
VKEAFSLGFKTVVLPKGNLTQFKKEDLPKIDLEGVSNIKEALGIIF